LNYFANLLVVVAAMQHSRPGNANLITMSDCAGIVLTGEVNSDLTADLAEVLEEALALGVPIEVDPHHVTYFGATGIAFLRELAERLPAKPALVYVPPTLAFLLDATNTRQLFQ
jgi:anti-anti-sigma regulatory factor